MDSEQEGVGGTHVHPDADKRSVETATTSVARGEASEASMTAGAERASSPANATTAEVPATVATASSTSMGTEGMKDSTKGSATDSTETKTVSRPGHTIEFDLRKVNPHIVCKLCAGYFIGATTIMECLHTFCKSCIVLHFNTHTTCPTCGITVNETNPVAYLRQDRTIQSLVYKIVNNLQEEQESREAKFYEEKGVKRPGNSPPSAADNTAAEQPSKKVKREDQPPDEQISFVLEKMKDQKELNEEDKNVQVTPLEKPYIRTSARATIQHLKKFLAKKLKLPRPEDVDILCSGCPLGNEHSLEYVARTRWNTNDQLVLMYRAKVDYDQ